MNTLLATVVFSNTFAGGGGFGGLGNGGFLGGGVAGGLTRTNFQTIL